MNTMTRLLVGAAMAGGLALTAAVPANAQVSIGIGIGAPGYYGMHRHWCDNHPRRCNGDPGYVAVGGPGYAGGPYVAGPAIGVYVGGRGYWDGHRYWGHRDWNHGSWRYR
jgi:hypothetical protein